MAVNVDSRSTNSDGNVLVEEHIHLVQHIVNQVAMRYPRHVDRTELWNAGALGLVDASRRYDPETGIPFARYAMIRIRGAIIDSTRTRDWATRSMRRNMRDVRAATEQFQAEHGRDPSSQELADTMGITLSQLDLHRSASVASSLLHLDQRIGTADGDETTLAELIEENDSELLPQEKLEDRELVGTLRVAITHLPDAQREVIERYYFAGEFLRDIADSMGVTEARVSQIRSEALNAVRAYFASAFDEVAEVEDRSPGRRSRSAFVSQMTARSTWRSRLESADMPIQVARSA